MQFVQKFWPTALIFVVIFAFLSNLFFPKQSLIVTPDYGRSDAWSLSVADSFYYAQELKKNNLPIWNPHIGNGFPVFAEGQTGELFPVNIMLFRLLPFALAYNLTLAFSLITAALGTYLFCRSFKLEKLTSTYASLIFSLGGFFIFHLQHHALIETASLFPWVFWATNEFIKTNKVKFLLIISMASALQFAAGFPQLAFYTQVSIIGYVFLSLLFSKTFKIKPVFFVIGSFALGFLLASVQLLPTYEFLNVSTRIANPGEILSQFPYNTKNLLQFLNPYILGSPRDGTYPLWQPGKWGIFWESSAYIGIIPLVLALGTILGNIFKTKKNKGVLCISALLLFAILLALGKESPLYVIFTMPPFSLFRVPSRFLLTAQFLIVVLAATYLNKVTKRGIALILIAISILDVFLVLKNYNPVLDAEKLLNSPESSQFLKNHNVANIYTVGNVNKWNENFLKNGWGNINKFYFFKNYLDQNSNLIFNINQFSAYESLQTKRQSFLKSQIASRIKFNNGTYFLSDNAIKLLAANNVSHIISPFEINSINTQQVFSASKNGDTINIYQISNPSGIAFLSNNYINTETTQDINEVVTNKNFDPINTPIIEGTLKNQPTKPTRSSFEITSISQTNLLAKVNVESNNILVFNQSFYPGWQAYIDGNETPIMPANINSMAIEIPKGNHNVIFKYYPRSLILGTLLSIASLLLWMLLFVKFRNVNLS